MKGREATRFVDLLGKERATTWLRFIHPQRRGAGGGDHQGLTSREHRELIEQRQAEGFNVYAVIGNADIASGKGGGVTDADITAVPALFVEWDDGASIEEQTARPAALGLPDPTVMVSTGGKSVHAYWVLNEPMAPDEWRPLQRRLIAHCNGDKACSNPARVMRLPGSEYISKTTGEPTGECQIISDPGSRYSAAEIAACLPATEAPPAPPRRPAAPPGRQPRGLDEISAAAACIPRRVGGEGTYEADRNALCGCSAALAEAGVADPDAAALALLGHLWPSERDAEQVLESTTTRSAASFWSIAREHGHQLQRQPPAPQPAAKANGFKPAAKEANKARKLSHAKAMACLDRCIEVQAKRERNSLRRRARLLKAAKDLGLSSYISRQDIAQRVLEAKAKANGERFAPLTAADRAAMPVPVLRWVLPGVVPAVDLTILGGRAKVGKTRLAMAAVAAALNGDGLLGMPAPSSPVPVVLVTDDQSDADTHDMLKALDIYEDPALIWSRSFRLTETDLDGLLATVKANPGALVVLDSLRSIGRALEKGENDPEIGAILYDLKAAVTDAGGTLLLIHHCNKTEALVGTEALSGHNAIAGAANTILTLHYLPGENGRPNKTAPERQLFREARSGAGFDLVITRDGARFRTVMPTEKWLEHVKAAKDQGNLNTLQEEVLEVLGAEYVTRRQVCDAVGVEWGDRGRGAEPQKVKRALKRLVEIGSAESVRAGIEATYRAPRVISPDDTDDSDASQSYQRVSMASPFDASDAKPPAQQIVASLASVRDATENGCGDWVASVSSLSSGSKPWHGRDQALIGSGADVMDGDGDDPHWPKRPAC